MENITAILNRKQAHFHTVSPDRMITDALQQMHCENVDYLVVLDESDRFLGILSDHDITSKVVFGRKSLQNSNVREVMNTSLPVATVFDTVEKCMRMMRQHNIRFVPVFDGFEFKGVISSDDIIHEIISHRTEVFDPEEDLSHVLA